MYASIGRVGVRCSVPVDENEASLLLGEYRDVAETTRGIGRNTCEKDFELGEHAVHGIGAVSCAIVLDPKEEPSSPEGEYGQWKVCIDDVPNRSISPGGAIDTERIFEPVVFECEEGVKERFAGGYSAPPMNRDEWCMFELPHRNPPGSQLLEPGEECLSLRNWSPHGDGVDENADNGGRAGKRDMSARPYGAECNILHAAMPREEKRPCTLNDGIDGDGVLGGELFE